MAPPLGSKDSHGHEQQIGTNCLGAMLFSELLVPTLKNTAASSPAGSVRVTFAASMAIYYSPTGGVDLTTGSPKDFPTNEMNYAQSKGGSVLLAAEFARRYGKDGIISLSWNPGNLRSELQRHMSPILAKVLGWTLLYPTYFGAYTELYAACSPEITESHNGAFVAPWGRVIDTRKDFALASKSEAEGGTGNASKFWDWCEKEAAPYK